MKGTLDHGRIHERVAIPTSSSSGRTTGTAGTGDGFSSSDNGAGGGAVNARSSGGREYYNVLNNSRDEKYSRGRRIKQSSARYNTVALAEKKLVFFESELSRF